MKFRIIPYRSVYTEFRIPSNENSSFKKLKKGSKWIIYAVEFAEFRKGSCIRNSVYLQMSSVLYRLKNIKYLKKLTPEV
jgi:hypothetical protein